MILRGLLFLLAFQMNIRVRASGPAPLLAVPPGCLRQQLACSVDVGARPWHWSVPEMKLDAVGGSVLQRNDGQWNLVKGTLRVRSLEETVTLRSLHGVMSIAAGSEAWLVTAEDKITFRAVRGTLRLAVRDGSHIDVPEGLEIWIGAINVRGENMHGVPEPISLLEHSRLLARLHVGSKEALKTEIAETKERWKERHLIAAEIYDRVAERHLASVAETERRQRAQAAQVQAERQRMKQLLFHKVFER